VPFTFDSSSNSLRTRHGRRKEISLTWRIMWDLRFSWQWASRFFMIFWDTTPFNLVLHRVNSRKPYCYRGSVRLFSWSKLVSYANFLLGHYCPYNVGTWPKSRDFGGNLIPYFLWIFPKRMDTHMLPRWLARLCVLWPMTTNTG
jgi:hypothetical protein